MAYTRSWTDNQSGAVPANTIDTIFANLRKDISDRMAVLFDSWTADPLVVKDVITGKRTGKKMFIPPTAFQPDGNDEGVHEVEDAYIQILNISGPWRAPLILPPGATIKAIRWLVYGSATNTITMRLYRTAFTQANGVTVLNTITKAATGLEIKSSGVVTIPVTEDGPMTLSIDMAGSDISDLQTLRIHGVEVTYAVEHSGHTL